MGHPWTHPAMMEMEAHERAARLLREADEARRVREALAIRSSPSRTRKQPWSFIPVAAALLAALWVSLGGERSTG